MKKIIAFLTACSLALSMTGCLKSIDKTGATLDADLTYAYISEPAEFKTSSITPLLTVSDGVLVGQVDGSRRYRLFHWSCETGEYTEVEVHNQDKKHGEASPVMLSDGRFGLIFQKIHPRVSKWDIDAPVYMDVYGADLQYQETILLPDMESGYLTQIVSAVYDGRDYLVMECGADINQIVLYDLENEEISGVINTDYVGLIGGSDGEAYACTYIGDNDSFQLSHISIAEGKLEPVTLNQDIRDVNMSITGSGEYAMYAYGKQAMYGIRVNGNQAEAELVMDFPASDFVNVWILTFKASPDGRFLVHEEQTNTEAFWITRKRTEEELENCKAITLAGVDLNNELKNTVVLYNRSHSDYHIVMVDYLENANASSGYWSSVGFMEDVFGNTDEVHIAAAERFRQDLIDGIVPDIICTDNLPYVQLANKGLFLDMTKLMEKDERFREEDYIMSFFDSMKYKGQQQTIAFSFYVNTISGKTELVGSKQGLSPDEFITLLNSTPENLVELEDYLGFYCSQERFRDWFLGWMQNSFLDTENATCSFDSPAFVRLLEIGSSLKKADDWLSVEAEGSLLQTEGFSQPIDYHTLHLLDYKNEDMTLIGYPTPDGGNGGIFTAPYQLGINARSKYQEEIWDIFMGMLSEDVQRSLDYQPQTYSFPVLRSAYEEDMALSAKGDRFIGLTHIGASTQEEVDFLKDYIEHMTMFCYTDPTITRIIREEVDMLYAGDQTAEEAAKMIQSRASLYISEQY